MAKIPCIAGRTPIMQVCMCWFDHLVIQILLPLLHSGDTDRSTNCSYCVCLCD